MPISARLHIGESRTTIGEVALAVGSGKLASEHFRHEPPAPLELENAIAAVEDELARIRDTSPIDRTLTTVDTDIEEIAAGEAVLTREAVELDFQRLTGRAPGPLGSRRLAATLVILRELMHHLQVDAITIDRQA